MVLFLRFSNYFCFAQDYSSSDGWSRLLVYCGFQFPIQCLTNKITFISHFHGLNIFCGYFIYFCINKTETLKVLSKFLVAYVSDNIIIHIHIANKITYSQYFIINAITGYGSTNFNKQLPRVILIRFYKRSILILNLNSHSSDSVKLTT